MDKFFMCRNAHPHEAPLVLGENAADYGMIAQLEGGFEKNGRQASAILVKKSKVAQSSLFVNEMKALMHYLKTDYANGLLYSVSEMQAVCEACGDSFSLVEKGNKVYGFTTHSGNYQFYIKCVPIGEKSRFTINCYNRCALINAGIITCEGDI